MGTKKRNRTEALDVFLSILRSLAKDGGSALLYRQERSEERVCQVFEPARPP